MRKTWVLLWTLLLLLQWVTVWVANRGHAVPPAPAVDRDLLELLIQTNKGWVELMPEQVAAAHAQSPLTSEDLVRQQELLLKLRDTESSLRRSGTETRIADDLERWLAGAGSGGAPARTGEFLARLLDWLRPFHDGSMPCRLERTGLHPEARSEFPSLAFELSGQPSLLGRSLACLNRDTGGLRLGEIDLFRPEQGESWWLRGSCLFAERGGN